MTTYYNSMIESMEHMAPLDYLLDSRQHYDSSWCQKKRQEESPGECNEVGSEQNNMGYYRCKIDDVDLYNNLCELCKPHITEEHITQCNHELDTQVNEGVTR